MNALQLIAMGLARYKLGWSGVPFDHWSDIVECRSCAEAFSYIAEAATK